jgi:hypothetical protein
MDDGRGCCTLTPPPKIRPHLNSVGPGVEIEGPRGVAVAAVRGGGGGVAAGAATTAGSAVIMPPSSVPQLSRVVVVSQRRWWRSTPGGGGTTEGGWGDKPLVFGCSGNKKRNLSSDYHARRHLICQSNHKTRVIWKGRGGLLCYSATEGT